MIKVKKKKIKGLIQWLQQPQILTVVQEKKIQKRKYQQIKQSRQTLADPRLEPGDLSMFGI